MWLSVSLQQRLRAARRAARDDVATTGGLVLMAPYFGYVFWFLEPMNIIARIRSEAVQTRGARGSQNARPRLRRRRRPRRSRAMEELTDITSNSISGKDKIIASGAVDALKDFALEYLQGQAAARAEAWFSHRRRHPRKPRLRRDGSGVARPTSSSAAPGSSGR